MKEYKVKVRASGGATKWGVNNLSEIRLLDTRAKLTEDKHAVILSDGRIVKPGEIIVVTEEELNGDA